MRKRLMGTVAMSLILSAVQACFAQGNFSSEQAKRLIQTGNWNGLTQYGTNWSQAEPNNDVAWFCIGEGAFRQHRYSMAVQNYERAAQVKPSQPAYWASVGFANMAMGNKAAAVKAVSTGESACASTMTADAWCNFGNILGQAGQSERAKVDLNKALALNPKCAGAYSSLGITAEREGNRPLAQQYYTKAAALGDLKAKNALARARGPRKNPIMALGGKDPFDQANNPFLHKFLTNPNPKQPLNNITERINAQYLQQHGPGYVPIGGH